MEINHNIRIRATIQTDYLIIGAGIIGLALAKELRGRYPQATIVVLEKELDVAFHSSGRNSGVLHAGFYYTANSLKAKFTKEGNLAMTRYCEENKLTINKCQKLVVAKNQDELEALFELHKRGKLNGVDIQLITADQAAKIDPNAKTYQHALFSPSTSTVNPTEVCQCLHAELKNDGVKFLLNEGFQKRLDLNTIRTQKGRKIQATKIINAAGLYADKVAKQYGYSKDYTIIPFKGIYLKYKSDKQPLQTNIYPVPNLKNPFLGVHYTLTAEGHTKIGPTSIPAFWRENYTGWSRFKWSEFWSILAWEAKLFWNNAFGFRNLAIQEIQKYRKAHFVNLAMKLVHKLDKKKFKEWTKPGIRAQLLNVHTQELVQDFVVEGDTNSTHILNAVSPAFTCSFPFAKWVVETYVVPEKSNIEK